jgi:hypothetical protein
MAALEGKWGGLEGKWGGLEGKWGVWRENDVRMDGKMGVLATFSWKKNSLQNDGILVVR